MFAAVDSIFDVPWEQVGLDELRAFLGSADDEGLLWEAKGPDPRKPDARFEARHVRESACGFANAVGGFTIAGARRAEDRSWELPGVVIPHDEPETWLDDALGTLSPRPRFAPRAFRLDDGRTAAVIRVEPVALPPCMTPGGEIYERTSGKTVKVTDPLVLARLIDEGRNARSRTEGAAQQAVKDITSYMEHRKVNVSLALRAARYDPDIASRLFADRSDDEPETIYRLRDVITAALRPDRYTSKVDGRWTVRQDSLIFTTDPGAFADHPAGGDHRWVVRAAWDGSVAIRCAGNEPEIGIGLLLGDVVVPAWRAAAAMIPILGGHGPGALVLRILDGFTLHTPGQGPVSLPSLDLGRWLEQPNPTDEMVSSVEREILRAAGTNAWEPR